VFRFAAMCLLALAGSSGCARPMEPDPIPDAMTLVPEPTPPPDIRGVEGYVSGSVFCALGARNDLALDSSHTESAPPDSSSHE
jgi:hypothetical protein